MNDGREVIKRGIMHCLMGVDSDGIADVVMKRLADAGLAIVPVEPTEAMMEAGEDTFVPTYTGTPSSEPGRVWQAMLRVAQEGGE